MLTVGEKREQIINKLKSLNEQQIDLINDLLSKIDLLKMDSVEYIFAEAVGQYGNILKKTRRMITLEEVLKLHELSIQFFGGSPGIRGLSLLESAIANYRLIASQNKAYDFIINIASSKISFEEIVNWLRQNTKQTVQSK